MADIFICDDLRSMFLKKRVVFLGDSNMRALYKDILCLYQSSQLIPQTILKRKMEDTVYGDKLVNHGEKTNRRDFTEDRVFEAKNYDFSFYFLTRVYNEKVEKILANVMEKKEPDVIVLNSCLWDICRWGPRGVEEYKKNLKKLMKKLNEILSPNCLVIWLTAPPVAQDPQGGLLVIQLEFMKYILRFHVLEANFYARKVVTSHGYDVLDIHYHLRMELHHRSEDGIHWYPEAMRYVTNLLLTHISLAWGIPLPKRYNSNVVTRSLHATEDETDKAFALESEVDTPAKSEKDQRQVPWTAEKKKKKFTNSYHAFAKKRRENQARNRIREWMNSPQHDRWQSRQRNYLPYKFSNPENFKHMNFNPSVDKVKLFKFEATPERRTYVPRENYRRFDARNSRTSGRRQSMDDKTLKRRRNLRRD